MRYNYNTQVKYHFERTDFCLQISKLFLFIRYFLLSLNKTLLTFFYFALEAKGYTVREYN